MDHAALSRFAGEEQSLNLVGAEKFAEYFGFKIVEAWGGVVRNRLADTENAAEIGTSANAPRCQTWAEFLHERRVLESSQYQPRPGGNAGAQLQAFFSWPITTAMADWSPCPVRAGRRL